MSKKMTVMQDKFIQNVIEGMSPSKAAQVAGYSCPDSAAQLLKNNQYVQKELVSRQLSALSTETLPKAIRRLDEILDDLSPASAGIKLKAAQYVIDKAQELQNMASASDIASKNPLEMTQAEMEIFVMRGRIVLKRESAMRDLGIIDEDTEAEDA